MASLSVVPMLLVLVLMHTSNASRMICINASTTPTLQPDMSQLYKSCDVISDINGGMVHLRMENTTLLLLPGVHILTDFVLIESVSDISIMGQGPDDDVVLKCPQAIGLVFINVTNLSIENVTIDGCAGMKEDNMVEVSRTVQQYVRLSPYNLQTNIARAVIIAECYNLHLKNVVIKRVVGVGLTALNVLGDSYLTNVNFYNNSHNNSLSSDEEKVVDIAGCAIFYFGDSLQVHEETIESMLHIEQCIFNGSVSSSGVSRHILVDEFFEIDDHHTTHNHSYPLDSAGGLTLIFSRSQNNSQYVSVTSSSFDNNMHQNGGCMYVLFHQKVTNVTVSLDGNCFEDCRGGSMGGGLLVGYGYPGTGEDVNHFYQSHRVVTVRNTVFKCCRATWGGGTAVVSLPNFATLEGSEKKIVFENCTWLKNFGTAGSALAFWEGKYHGVQRKFGLDISLVNCTFFNNFIEGGDLPQLNSAVVNMDAVSVKFFGTTVFKSNQLSCIGATRSELQVHGKFVAQTTQVIYGGVLDFRDASFLVVKEGANILLANNSALWRGGAVSVNMFAPWPLSNYSSCFLHFEKFHSCMVHPCYNLTDYDRATGPPYTIRFINNSASFFGNEIFGATFHACPWLSGKNATQSLAFIANELAEIIRFSVNITSNHEAINGYMNNVAVDFIPETVMPGQEWRANVTVLDNFNHTVPAVSTLRLPLENGTVNTAGNFSVDGTLVTFVEQTENLRFVFNGTPNEFVRFQFLPTSLFQPVGNFNFTFSDCKPGFLFKEELRFCMCDDQLQNLHRSIKCHKNGSISHGPLRWIGFKNHSNSNNNNNNNNNNSNNNNGNISTHYLYVTSLCIFDYCNESSNVIENLGDDSEQCNYNRRGILCGGCKDGYSRVFGSNRCIQCSNLYLLNLLPYFVSGILLVACIFAFQITIATGYLNGAILYANIVSTFATVLFPVNAQPEANVAFILISVINLSIGFETCFYNGTTELHLAALKLTYPFYLLSIIGCIALIAKVCPNRFLQAKVLHPIQVTATVLFISFTSLFQSVIEILEVAVLNYHGHHSNKTHFKWLLDPNVTYGTGLHAVLVPIAVLILVFVLVPEVVILIFFKPLLKVKGIGRILSQKWWPFFDAFQNPYVDHLRFWIGIQLLLRVASLSIASFQQLTNIENISLRNFTLFFTVMVLITFTVAEAFFKPFKGVIRNVIDLIFLLNLIYLLSTALYYNLLRLSIQADEKDIEYIREVHRKSVQACLNMAIILIAFIIAGFLVVRFALLKLFVKQALPRFPQKLQIVIIAVLCDAGYQTDVHHNRVKRQKKVAKTPTTTVVSVPPGSSSDQEQEEIELRPQRLQSELEYSRYRDSILEDVSSTLSI